MRSRSRARTTTFAAVLTCLAAIALAGCGGGSTRSTSADGTMTASLVVGGEKSMVYMAIPLAESLGYLKEEKVDLEVVDAGEAGRAVGTLIAGQADFASGSFEHVVKAKGEGKSLVMTALYVKYPAMSLIVGSDHTDEIRTIEDLRGKRVGTSSPGSAAHYNLLALLKKHGMTERDVELVFAGLSEMPAAIQNDQVVAGMVIDPFTTQTVQSGRGTMLFDLGTANGSQELYGSQYAMSGLMTRQDLIQDNPELVRRVTSAASRALEYIGSHTPEEVADAMPSDFAPDKKVLAAAIAHMKDSFTADGRMPAEAAQATAEVLVENGIVPEQAAADVPALYDMQFVGAQG